MAWPGFPGKTQKHVTLFLEAFLTVTQICNFWGQCSVLASLALTTVSRGDRVSLGRAIMSQHTSWVMGTRIRLFSEDAGPSKNAGPRHATQSFFLRCRAVRDPHVPTENKTPPAHVPTLLAVLLVPCMCQAPSSWAWRHSDSETVLIFERKKNTRSS